MVYPAKKHIFSNLELNYHHLQYCEISIPDNQDCRKNKKSTKFTKGLMILKTFAVPEPLNTHCLKTWVLEPERANRTKINMQSDTFFTQNYNIQK